MNNPKKEDFRLQVTVKSENLQIENIPCKVYLPKRVTDPISLEFHPDEQKGISLLPLFDGAIYGEVKDISGAVSRQIHATKVYFSNKREQTWGDGSEISLTGTPRDLTITTFFGHSKDRNPDRPTTGSFWLTPSEMLSPDQILHPSSTGEVTIETRGRKQFILENNVCLSFNKHFHYVTGDNNDLVTFSELVAEYEITGTTENHEKVILDSLGDLDDFLLVASFAASQPCVCLGWESVKSTEFTKHYRRDRIIPPMMEESKRTSPLIDISEFEDFIQSAYRHFIDFEAKGFLRRALGILVFQYGRNISEGSFLSLYSALETLILWFRGKFDLENILPDDQWPQFQKDFEKWLKSHPSFSQNSEKRKHLYENVRGLNHISLSSAFTRFCNDLSVYTQDLWPVFGNTEGASLSLIRNKLIHGVPLDPRQIKSLIPVYVHLRTLVERSILALFQWPIENSRVYTGATDDYGGENWREERKILSQAFLDLPELPGS